jgi:hypothetical protein
MQIKPDIAELLQTHVFDVDPRWLPGSIMFAD